MELQAYIGAIEHELSMLRYQKECFQAQYIQDIVHFKKLKWQIFSPAEPYSVEHMASDG